MNVFVRIEKAGRTQHRLGLWIYSRLFETIKSDQVRSKKIELEIIILWIAADPAFPICSLPTDFNSILGLRAGRLVNEILKEEFFSIVLLSLDDNGILLSCDLQPRQDDFISISSVDLLIQQIWKYLTTFSRLTFLKSMSRFFLHQSKCFLHYAFSFIMRLSLVMMTYTVDFL